MNALKFNQLLKQIKYDAKAVEEIYSEYFLKVKCHVRYKFGNLVDPEDVAHDIYLKLLTLKDQKFVNNPLSWLYALADHYVVDQLRKQHIEVEIYDSLVEDLQSERSILQEDMKSAMKQLDAVSQKIIYLRFWEGMKLKEIAKELKLSYGNVRIKAVRAYRALDKIL